MDYNSFLKKVEFQEIDSKNYLIYNKRILLVGTDLYRILKKAKHTHIEIENLIDQEELIEEEKKIVISKINEMFFALKMQKTNNYINYRIKLINTTKTNLISKYLKIIIPKSFYIFFFSLLIINVIFLYFFKHVIFSKINLDILDLFIYYIFIFLILIFHEFGHSSASLKFKKDPDEIGLGFYLFFPVLYSNVTKIWLLNKSERVIVNLSGIYFQLFFNLILIIILTSITNQDVTNIIVMLIRTNLFIAAYSLIPFTRNDGYWVISDYLEISNLQKKSNDYLYSIIRKKNIKKHSETPKKYTIIKIYSILNSFFIIYIYIFIFWFVCSFLIKIWGIDDGFLLLKENLYQLIISLMAIYILFKMFYKNIVKKEYD
ncbi:hypothetical protein [Myroides odoratus]|uniref:hypothetical protein n=1 Tax=Myroides odoratus TaxID=256 RepID=UPI003342BBAA